MKDDIIKGFKQEIIELNDDYEGKVQAVLVSKKSELETEKAILYIHGFADYFFNAELADACIDAGFDFYALDLRKYGRSLLSHQHPNFCKDLSEYFEEIDQAVSIIKERDSHSTLVLNGHSTGGLTASLYTHERRNSNVIDGLLLNSPWYGINENWLIKNVIMKATYAIGKLFPFSKTPKGLDPNYACSVHKDQFIEVKKANNVYEKGVWDFNITWKSLGEFPVYRGFLRAVRNGQKNIQKGLDIKCPVFLLNSDKKGKRNKKIQPHYFNSDCVLNPEHMVKYISRVGEHIKQVTIKDGMHDLALSQKRVRERYFKEIKQWLLQEF